MANKISNPLELVEVTTPTAPVAGVRKLYPKSDGRVYQLASTGTERRLAIVEFLQLAANFNDSTTTLNVVPGMSFNMEAGKSYHVRFVGAHQTVLATTGIRLGISGTGTVVGSYRAATSSATVATELATPINTTATTIITTGVAPAGARHHCEFELVINCTTASLFSLRFGSEVAGSVATLLAGSTLIITQLN